MARTVPGTPALPPPTAAADAGTPAAIVSLQVIEALADVPEGLGVTQLGQRLGMPKARMHRHLVALRDNGYVAQDSDTSVYRLGWRLYLLGQACTRHFDVMTLAKPALEKLREAVGQTIVIARASDREIVVIDLLRGTAPVEISLRPGTRFALNASAQGKVVLAFGPSQGLADVLAEPLAAPTPRTITDAERLRSEVELVRRRGWADAPEELFTGVNALAAPLYQRDGALFGTIAIVGSIHYLPATAIAAHVEALLETARTISAALGDTR